MKLEVIEEVRIDCSYCGIKLADVVVTETNEARINRGLKEQRIVIKIVGCPECGKESFQTKVLEGSTNIVALNDQFCLEDEDTDIKNNIIYSTLKVVRHG